MCVCVCVWRCVGTQECELELIRRLREWSQTPAGCMLKYLGQDTLNCVCVYVDGHQSSGTLHGILCHQCMIIWVNGWMLLWVITKTKKERHAVNAVHLTIHPSDCQRNVIIGLVFMNVALNCNWTILGPCILSQLPCIEQASTKWCVWWSYIHTTEGMAPTSLWPPAFPEK